MPFGGALYYLDRKRARSSREFEKLYKESPGVVHPEVKKAIKSHNIKILRTEKQIGDWLNANTVYNKENFIDEEDFDNYLDNTYESLAVILETANAAAILPDSPGGQAGIVISPDIYNSAIMGHEVGHILDWSSRGITNEEELAESSEDHPGIGNVLTQIIPGMPVSGHPVMKREVAAWDHAQVPSDDPLRNKALETYSDALGAPQYVTGGLATGFLARPWIKKLLKMKK